MKCSYGCGNEVTHWMKSGKGCCSKSPNSCPTMRANNSAGAKRYIETLSNPNDRFRDGIHPKSGKSFTSPFKGMTLEDKFGARAAEVRKRQSEGMKGKNPWNKMSEETANATKEKMRNAILCRYEDGWMPKAGRCRKITYTSEIAGEVRLDGTWELGVAKWLDDQKLQWVRNTDRFFYTHITGKMSYYTPDFWIENWGSYLEIKGYETELDRCKWAQFCGPLLVWTRKDLLDRHIPVR